MNCGVVGDWSWVNFRLRSIDHEIAEVQTVALSIGLGFPRLFGGTDFAAMPGSAVRKDLEAVEVLSIGMPAC